MVKHVHFQGQNHTKQIFKSFRIHTTSWNVCPDSVPHNLASAPPNSALPESHTVLQSIYSLFNPSLKRSLVELAESANMLAIHWYSSVCSWSWKYYVSWSRSNLNQKQWGGDKSHLHSVFVHSDQRECHYNLKDNKTLPVYASE